MRVRRASVVAIAAAVVCGCGWLVGSGSEDLPARGEQDAADDVLVDVAAIFQDDSGPVDAAPCVPKTCGDQGANCGAVPNGCGGRLEDCGACVAPATCGGGGPNQCGSGTCVPTTCGAANAECGSISDTCGLTLECGKCPYGNCGTTNRCECVDTATSCLKTAGYATCGAIMPNGSHLVGCKTGALVPAAGCQPCVAGPQGSNASWFCCPP